MAQLAVAVVKFRRCPTGWLAGERVLAASVVHTAVGTARPRAAKKASSRSRSELCGGHENGSAKVGVETARTVAATRAAGEAVDIHVPAVAAVCERVVIGTCLQWLIVVR